MSLILFLFECFYKLVTNTVEDKLLFVLIILTILQDHLKLSIHIHKMDPKLLYPIIGQSLLMQLQYSLLAEPFQQIF